MANFTVTGTRPKSIVVNDLLVGIVLPVIEINTLTNSFIQYFQLENLTALPSSFIINSTYELDSTSIVSHEDNSFINVRVGDILSGTGIAENTKVLEKIDNSNIVVSLPTTSVAVNSPVTFYPQVFNSNLGAYKVSFSQSESILTCVFELYMADPSVINDANSDGVDDSTIEEYGKVRNRYTLHINLDEYLTKARVER